MFQLAQKGDKGPLATILGRLEDDSQEVRQTVLENLPTLVDKGDDNVITLVCERLEHPSVDVKCTALMALPLVCNQGDGRTLSTVRMLLLDQNQAVRGCAFK